MTEREIEDATRQLALNRIHRGIAWHEGFWTGVFMTAVTIFLGRIFGVL